jgi:hypothetical protein
MDSDPDTSVLGEYTDEYEDWNIVAIGKHQGKFCIKVPDRELPETGHQFKYFKPADVGVKAGSKLYRKYALENYKRIVGLENGIWSFLGITARAEVMLARSGGGIIQHITSGGLWGIESDLAEEDIKDIEDEELRTLRSELIGYGFNKKDVAKAMKGLRRIQP